MHVSFRLFVLTLFVVFALPVGAQDDLPAPQFLYRDDDQLVFINGYTGETTPINNLVVAEGDRFEWSPDGRYLVGYVAHGNARNCLNLFDVDAEVWIYDEPIACNVSETLFSSDSTILIYSTTGSGIRVRGIWQFSITDASSQLLFNRDGDQLRWSPHQQYVSFKNIPPVGAVPDSVYPQWLIVVHMETRAAIEVGGFSPRVIEDPRWSPDERWFLMVFNVLHDPLILEPRQNFHFAGDIFLVNPISGETRQITFTPTHRESNIFWITNQQIQFDETYTVTNTLDYTVDEALRIERPDEADIVYPPEGWIESPYDTVTIYNPTLSPDERAAVWTVENGEGYTLLSGEVRYNADSRMYEWRSIVFEQPLSPDYEQNGVLIGWRPDPQNQ